MFDAASPSDTVRLQRAVGRLSVSFRRRGDATVLDRLHQQGCLKARFPRPEPGECPVAVTLNTAGGIAGGDALDLDFAFAPGTRATIAAQAAERFYRAIGAPARVRTRVAVEAGAEAEWLPQETILFDRCALDRRLDVSLAADAVFLGVETLVFGRAAMGETVKSAVLRDLIRIDRDGIPVLHDAIRLDGPVASVLDARATGGGCRAVATLMRLGAGSEPMLDAVRAALEPHDAVESGVSAWNGMLLARILGPDSLAVRRATVAVLDVVHHGRPLPRMWNC